jgi:hypothetical protein
VTGSGSGIVASVCGTKLYIHTDECADRGAVPAGWQKYIAWMRAGIRVANRRRLSFACELEYVPGWRAGLLGASVTTAGAGEPTSRCALTLADHELVASSRSSSFRPAIRRPERLRRSNAMYFSAQ